MYIPSELDSRSPIVKRALRLRERALLHTQESAGAVTRRSTRQDWNKLELAPACGVLLTCSARSQ